MKKIKILIFLCFILTLFVSCNKEVEYMPHLRENIHNINIDLSGKFDDNKLKTIFFTDDGETEGIPKNKIIWNKVRDLQVALILKNQSNTYVLKGYGQVNADTVNVGNYKIHIHAEYKSDSEINIDDSYYISGVLGGNLNDKDSSLSMSVSKILKKDLRELDIPVGFPWIRLKSDNINDNFVTVNNIVFNPIGNLIGFAVASEIYDPINVVGLNVRTNIFSADGYFDFIGSSPKEGEYIAYNTPGNNADIDYTLSSDNPDDLSLKSNQSVKYFYTWVMPNKTLDNKYLSVGFKIKPVCRDAISSKEKENIKVLDTPDFDRWTPNQVPQFTHGKPFFIKTKVQSTHPIITEVFHRSEWDNRQHSTVIEIYNPSSKPIDISDYYIARSVAGNVYHGYDKAYSDFDNALLYPLYIKDGHTVRTPNDMTTEKSDIKLDFKTFYGSQITQDIQPGKTVLLLGDLYHKDFNSTDHLIGDRGVGSYVKDKCFYEFKSIQYIVCSDKNPRCTLTPTPSNSNDRGKVHRSHILKFNPDMGFVLLKKVTSEPFDKEVSDVKTGGKNRFLAVDSYGPYFKETIVENPLTQYKDERFFVIKYDGVVFPSGGNYYPDQWRYINNDYIKVNTDITSIGARYMFWKSRLVIPEMSAGN